MANNIYQTLKTLWGEQLPAGLGLSSSFKFATISRPLSLNPDNSISEQDIYKLCNFLPSKKPIETLNIDLANEKSGFFEIYKTIVLNCIKYPKNDNLKRLLADHYSSWQRTRDTLPPIDNRNGQKVISKFQEWAKSISLEVSAINRAKAYLNQEFHNPVADGKSALENDQNYKDGRAIYNPTSEILAQKLTTATPKSCILKGKNLTFEVVFEKVVTASIKCGNWFNSSTLSLAYRTKDNTVWIADKEYTWDNTFGDAGHLSNLSVEFVIVDGLSASLKVPLSARDFLQEDPYFPTLFNKLQIETKYGKEDLEVTYKSPKGNPTLLGINIDSVSHLMGG